MGQRLIITEEEKNKIQSLYENMGVAFGNEMNGLKVKKETAEEEGEEEMFAKASMTKYLDTMDREVKGDIEFYEKKEFGPEDYDSFMEYINNCDTKWCLTTKRFYDRYVKMGNITVGKGTRR
jgi:hypothetical protein